MGIERHKLYWLLAIVLYLPNTRASCELTELPKVDEVCTANLECDQVITFDRTTWDCIKHVKNVYNNNDYYYRRSSRRETTYDINYNIFVIMKNVDDQKDIFEGEASFLANIKRIQIEKGNWLSVPLEIYKLSKTTEIEISNNKISEINLNNFVPMLELTSIILKNNSITTMHTEMNVKLTSRSIKTIDLSWNLLEVLPGACFSSFTELEQLNLSYNNINNFDILTFEGVMELHILDVSHNKILEIGNSFTRFINLRELYLQNNKLSKLVDYNLSTLTALRKLNLSSNKIDTIENNTFKNLLMLEYLDISNNRIVTITKNLFRYNINLQYLFISENNIKHIEGGAFEKLFVIEFNMQNNNLTGNIEKDYFNGIHVSNLDISNGRIASLGKETFKFMCEDLNSLNISFNQITDISLTAFACLNQLTVLDLSHNIIKDLDFETSSLKNLTNLYLNHNKIEKIQSLSNLTSLKSIDLSFNEIKEIELNSFLGLNNMETLKLKHNPFVLTLKNNTFDGLVALQSIDLSNTRTVTYENRSFSGLSSLIHINASFGQLSNLAYNAFIETDSIETLDLSNNLLNIFHVNTSSISKIQEINLNYNLIQYVSNDTFSGLKLLRRLSLIHNDIQRMEAFALKDLVQLSHLFLSFNRQMDVIGNPFDNLTNIYQVNMDGVMTNFTFQSKTSIENLDLHSCGIKNLSKLSIFKVSDLRELNISNNRIEKIDKFSFQSLPFLVKLDLSSNRISFIQPGSFLQVGGLRTLTLYRNNLETLQFGVFDGVKALNFVNLSSNALLSFDPKLLPVAQSIALDNNDISDLNFAEFFESSVSKLSIGGNRFSCKTLAELKTSNYSEKFQNVVTTATLDYHSENVDGISCQSVQKNDLITPLANFTSYDVRPVLTKFTNAIEDLHSAIEKLGNNDESDKSHQSKSDIAELVGSLQALGNIFNQTQIKTDSYLKKIELITNAIQAGLINMTDQLINITEKKYSVADYDKSYNVKSNENNDAIRSEMKDMLKEEIDAIREEFGKTFENIENKPALQVVDKETKNDKVLYFIAASLGIIIVLYVLNIVHGYFKRERIISSLHSSRRPITSEMEME